MLEYRILRINLIKFPDDRYLRVATYKCTTCDSHRLKSIGFRDEDYFLTLIVTRLLRH